MEQLYQSSHAFNLVPLCGIAGHTVVTLKSHPLPFLTSNQLYYILNTRGNKLLVWKSSVCFCTIVIPSNAKYWSHNHLSLHQFSPDCYRIQTLDKNRPLPDTWQVLANLWLSITRKIRQTSFKVSFNIFKYIFQDLYFFRLPLWAKSLLRLSSNHFPSKDWTQVTASQFWRKKCGIHIV